MFRQLEIATMRDVERINEAAHEARLLCNDIIRQTSIKPYYGKRGGAAVYAHIDESEQQRRRMNIAVRLLQRATNILHDAAVSGGMVEAQLRENMRGDVCTRGQFIELPDDDN